MNNHIGGTARTAPSAGEVVAAKELAVRDFETARDALATHLDRSALPDGFVKLVQAVVPVLGEVVVGIIAAKRLSSDGGGKVTKAEAQAIAARAAKKIEWVIFTHLVPA